MRKSVLCTLMVVALVSLLAVGAAAQQETTVWNVSDNAITTKARVFNSIYSHGERCNGSPRTAVITTEAQVAQWLEWSLSGSKWTWFVKKPGDYYTDCITATIQSNGNVTITFDGFGALKYLTGTSVNPVIPTWYGYSEGEEGPKDPTSGWSGWYKAGEVVEGDTLTVGSINDTAISLTDSQRLHDGYSVKLWNRIKVVECNSASTYRDTGTISMMLASQKPWIDGAKNDYVDDLSSFVNGDRGEPTPAP